MRREGLTFEDYEVQGGWFPAQFIGRCTLDYDHKIRLGDKVARVQRTDNPMLPVPGVACPKCLKMLPRAKR